MLKKFTKANTVSQASKNGRFQIFCTHLSILVVSSKTNNAPHFEVRRSLSTSLRDKVKITDRSDV
jgi:hypothetical protein